MKKILIIENEEDLGEIYQLKLLSAGYEVKIAPQPKEANKLARNFKADLLLIDHGITDEEDGGIEAMPSLKKDFPKAKLVIFSNYGDPELRKKALSSMADDYWIKAETSLEQLVKKVSIILSK